MKYNDQGLLDLGDKHALKLHLRRVPPVLRRLIKPLQCTLCNCSQVDGVTGRSYTYAELDANVYRLASGLHRLGIQKAEVVVIFCPNSIEYIFAVLAIVANGATVAFVNPVYTACKSLLSTSTSMEHAIITCQFLKL